jgi:hypothetical protein
LGYLFLCCFIVISCFHRLDHCSSTGNNYYNDELRAKLQSLDVDQRAEFILMQRIQPPLHPALLMRQGKLMSAAGPVEIDTQAQSLNAMASPTASELGIYGVYLG